MPKKIKSSSQLSCLVLANFCNKRGRKAVAAALPVSSLHGSNSNVLNCCSRLQSSRVADQPLRAEGKWSHHRSPLQVYHARTRMLSKQLTCASPWHNVTLWRPGKLEGTSVGAKRAKLPWMDEVTQSQRYVITVIWTVSKTGMSLLCTIQFNTRSSILINNAALKISS